VQVLSGDARRAVFAPLDDGALRSAAVERGQERVTRVARQHSHPSIVVGLSVNMQSHRFSGQ
jgi:hypothetical protein